MIKHSLKCLRLVLMLPMFVLGLPEVIGEIFYLEPEKAIWVMNFTRDDPANMDDLFKVDREKGWNLVDFNPKTDTYVMRCSLWIGSVATWNPTYFQIGRPGHERETVIVHGNVWIRPPRKSLERVDGKFGLINRLTLGTPQNKAIKPTLKIACEADGQYGLFIGERAKDFTPFYGGELFAYNSIITAAVQDGKHEMRGTGEGIGPIAGFHTGWYASRVELKNTDVSWVDGCVAYGINKDYYSIKGCVFDHCGTVLMQREQKLVDCRFFNIKGPAVSGKLIEFIRCAFKGNDNNWQVQNLTGIAVEMINCDIGASKRPLTLSKNKYGFKKLLRLGAPEYPLFVERRSCAVKVVDDSGKPLYGVPVSVQCLNDKYAGQLHLEAVRNPFAITDSQGMTPTRFEDGAILPAVRRLQATEDPLKPKQDALTYNLIIEAPGRERVKIPLNVNEIGIDKIKIVKIK